VFLLYLFIVIIKPDAMINEKWVKQYCCEDVSKIYGYKEAVADKEKMWHLHHCLGLVWSREQLIEMGLYYNQPADRLMFVTRSQHTKLHIITKPTSNGKKYLQYTKDGVFVKEWSAKKEIIEQLGVKPEHLYACCNGYRETCGGFIWRYKNNPL